MYIVTNTSKIKPGESHKLVTRFDKEGQIEKMPGFLGLEVMVTDKLEEYDEVTVSTKWEDEASFQHWMDSDAFKQAHSYKGGRPDYIISNKIDYFDVKIVRQPIVPV